MKTEKIPLAERVLPKRTSAYGWKVSELPDIFSDELSSQDFVLISHVETKTSHKCRLRDLVAFLKKQLQ